MNAGELVGSWFRGRATVRADGAIDLAPAPPRALSEKLRAAYSWILENAIHAASADLRFGPPTTIGEGDLRIELTTGPGWSSFLLLPLLNLVVCRRLLFVGAPGRGKTSVATFMALLAGSPRDEVHRGIQRGHPQLTHADLLGAPLPAELVAARRPEDIHVSWRRWITQRVKIVDEYNRIPTKTQSALLSLMAEGRAEIFEQVISVGRSAWFLTANDDLGGGTFPVIEALRDRIDVTVRCTPFDTAQLDALRARLERGIDPEATLPAELVFTPEELDAMYDAVLAVPVPDGVQSALTFFLGQLDFCRRASSRLEYMNKDTLHVAGKRLAQVCNEDCPLDKDVQLCTQTENGVSARAWQSLLHFAKALAWFRGAAEVSMEDIAALLPWVLHEKLQPNAHSAFFQKPENQVHLIDRATWIRALFDRAVALQASWQKQSQAIAQERSALSGPIDALSSSELHARRDRLRVMLETLARRHELNAPLHAELLRVRALLDRHEVAIATRRAR